MDFDVIIIGAGPAGCTAAYQLAKSDKKVLIIDQDAFPRYKPCGGGIPLRVIRELPFDLAPALDFPAQGGEVTFKGETKLRTELDGEFAWLAMRDRMDNFLLEKAQEAGAEAITGMRMTNVQQEGTKVVVKVGKKSFSAGYVIGADGVNSMVARSFGLLTTRRTGIALEAEIAVPEPFLNKQGRFATFDFGALPNGYGWIFPKSDHLSVGVFQADSRKTNTIKEDLARFIDCQPLLRQHQILKIQGHRIPLGGENSILHAGRCLLVGDAANLADPWLGEGIYFAVRSGEIAAAVLSKVHQKGSNDLSEYTRLIQNEIIRDFKYSNRIGTLVYRFPALATSLICRSRTMQREVFSNMRGDITFQQLWNHLLLNFPRIWMESFINGGKRSL